MFQQRQSINIIELNFDPVLIFVLQRAVFTMFLTICALLRS